eukprot:6917903-Alexandrium_andersonii.AAC.1
MPSHAHDTSPDTATRPLGRWRNHDMPAARTSPIQDATPGYVIDRLLVGQQPEALAESLSYAIHTDWSGRYAFFRDDDMLRIADALSKSGGSATMTAALAGAGESKHLRQVRVDGRSPSLPMHRTFLVR